jgi:REP element-mobilizing transposase RayT
MTRPRSSLVSVGDTPYYHCICRCVRRAWLCGEDPVSGKSFEYRKEWMRARLALLTEIFAIRLCAYAVMSNHYHLVVRLAPEQVAFWSDLEVAERWTRIFTGPLSIQRFLHAQELTTAEQAQVKETLDLWRARLADLSWFMRCLNESLARQANAEDGCTGRFWEGRFKSQALLDEAALLTAMVYVDLNPIRAGVADTLRAAAFTSVQQRLHEAAGDQLPCAAAASFPRLLPFADRNEEVAIPFRLQDYLELAEVTGHCAVPGKSGVLAPPPGLLNRVGLEPAGWLAAVTRRQARFELFLGAPRRLRVLAAARGWKWIRGQSALRTIYAKANK